MHKTPFIDGDHVVFPNGRRLPRVRGGDGTDDPKPDPPKDDPKPEPKNDPKPPWGSDAEFDPEKAWQLVQGLRADKDKLKGERDGFKGKLDERDRENESAAEKAQREKDEALQRATTAEGQALRLEVALDKAPDGMALGQVRKLAKRLTGTTKEEMEADADELFADFQPVPTDDDPKPGSRRPREQLRPGAAPSAEPEETDPRKLAAAVEERY
jgi:hypothetical protein